MIVAFEGKGNRGGGELPVITTREADEERYIDWTLMRSRYLMMKEQRCEVEEIDLLLFNIAWSRGDAYECVSSVEFIRIDAFGSSVQDA
jgi:hypothetical protein